MPNRPHLSGRRGIRVTSGGIEAPGSLQREAMTDEDSKEDPTVLAPTLDEFRPEKMTKYVIWASVIQQPPSSKCRAGLGASSRVGSGFDRDPGGRSDRRSRFYAPS